MYKMYSIAHMTQLTKHMDHVGISKHVHAHSPFTILWQADPNNKCTFIPKLHAYRCIHMLVHASSVRSNTVMPH